MTPSLPPKVREKLYFRGKVRIENPHGLITSKKVHHQIRSVKSLIQSHRLLQQTLHQSVLVVVLPHGRRSNPSVGVDLHLHRRHQRVLRASLHLPEDRPSANHSLHALRLRVPHHRHPHLKSQKSYCKVSRDAPLHQVPSLLSMRKNLPPKLKHRKAENNRDT